jgi:NitT/TauT family transport system substrate-binding protein
VNHAQLLAAGRLDFNMAPTSFVPLNFVRENIPAVAVAAMFQKDPQVLIAHAEAGYKSLADMKGKPIMIGSDTRIGTWLFLKSRFGFTDDQIRPYTFNVAPFLTNKEAIQQGYLTSEPYIIQKAGAKPAVFLLADEGYAGYAALIQTLSKTVDGNPGVVQRFVDASAEGWYSYLYGDPSPANALIKKDNAEMTDDLLAYGMAKMKEYGIVDSGDSLTHGIGAMTEARWRTFFEMMSKAGLYPADMDWKKAFTLAFANKKVGMALKK